MTIGNIVAISQSNIRRLFGYSTIAHAGYLLVGVAAGVQAAQGGLEAAGVCRHRPRQCVVLPW